MRCPRLPSCSDAMREEVLGTLIQDGLIVVQKVTPDKSVFVTEEGSRAIEHLTMGAAWRKKQGIVLPPSLRKNSSASRRAGDSAGDLGADALDGPRVVGADDNLHPR